MVFDLGAIHPATQRSLWTWGANPRGHRSPEQCFCAPGSWECTVGQSRPGA